MKGKSLQPISHSLANEKFLSVNFPFAAEVCANVCGNSAKKSEDKVLMKLFVLLAASISSFVCLPSWNGCNNDDEKNGTKKAAGWKDDGIT